MSSHPGSTLEDAVELAVYLKKNGCAPDQVQDFYPTPSTASTVMYYTGIDPMTGKSVYTADTIEEKRMQRALLHYNRKENYGIVRKALMSIGRNDLIGYGRDCLVPPENNYHEINHEGTGRRRSVSARKRADKTKCSDKTVTSNRIAGKKKIKHK